MALKSDDSDLAKTWLTTDLGGNGDYYITIHSESDFRSVRISTSGGNATPRIRNAAAELYRAMQEAELNEWPGTTRYQKTNSGGKMNTFDSAEQEGETCGHGFLGITPDTRSPDRGDKWKWKMEYCRKRRLAPAAPGSWDLAEKAYEILNGK